MVSLTTLTADELVRRILAGERSFSATRISADQGNLAAVDGYADMNAYLLTQDLRDQPIEAHGVDWRGLQAPGLYFLGSKLAGADLSGANLAGADLRRADLTGGRLRDADLRGTVFNQGRFIEVDFTGATMGGADFYEANFSRALLIDADLAGAYTLRANLSGADFTGSQLTRATFYRTDLRGAKGLASARDLGTCEFRNTVVTVAERRTIEQAIDSLPRFDVREEVESAPSRDHRPERGGDRPRP
jgi:uncharacterized protein YjbI with pentapeptide repeats